MYDMRFYLQAIVDYFGSCKQELGITDVHWSDDDNADGIVVITENDVFVINGECFPGIGESARKIFKED